MKPSVIINQLSSLGSRLGASETQACDLLCSILDKNSIEYVKQNFNSTTPKYASYSLKADGQEIDCLPCGLVSGKITSNYNLISSLTSSQNFIDTPNINFNPRSDAICLCNLYFAPALAISRKDVPKVMNATKIEGSVEVEKQPYTATNILIGNTLDPKNVIFAHFDAYYSGATDNASGVAVPLSLILDNPELLEANLFVLAGNEELSYDYPIYWGRCFREFQKANGDLLNNAKSIIVVDSVGDGVPVVETDPRSLSLAFPVDDKELIAKAKIVTGDFDALMTVYHSDADTSQRLSDDYLDQTIKLIKSLLG